jgi:hypothetical protein
LSRCYLAESGVCSNSCIYAIFAYANRLAPFSICLCTHASLVCMCAGCVSVCLEVRGEAWEGRHAGVYQARQTTWIYPVHVLIFIKTITSIFQSETTTILNGDAPVQHFVSQQPQYSPDGLAWKRYFMLVTGYANVTVRNRCDEVVQLIGDGAGWQGWEGDGSPLELELKTDFQTFSLPVQLCKSAERSATSPPSFASRMILEPGQQLLPHLVGVPSTY